MKIPAAKAWQHESQKQERGDLESSKVERGDIVRDDTQCHHKGRSQNGRCYKVNPNVQRNLHGHRQDY